MLAIVAAMKRELAGIERALSLKRRPGPRGRYLVEGAYGGQRVILITTGPGRSRTEEVISYISSTYRPSAVVCLGYAGAASEELRVGDLVLYSRVLLEHEGTDTSDRPGPAAFAAPDPRLETVACQALRQGGLSFHRGAGLSVSRSVGDPDAKKRIGRQMNVIALDMESYWVAEAAVHNSLPFLGIRAISDPMCQRVPNLTGLVDGNGETSLAKTLAHVLRRPMDLYPMFRLAWNTRIASRNLARFASSFLTCYSKESNDSPCAQRNSI